METMETGSASQYAGSETAALVAENDDLFAMTALPESESTHSDDENDEDADDALEMLLDDIGYNKLVGASGAADPDLSESLARLAAKVESCRELQRSLKASTDELAEAQRQTAAASRQDAEQQRVSDGRMEHIRKMEDEAARITNSIPISEARAEDLELENQELRRKIAVGPVWTEEQLAQKSSLSDAIDVSRSAVSGQNNRLAGLRSRIESAEREVDESIRRRDESIASLEAVNANIETVREEQQAVLLQTNEAERSKDILVETRRAAEADLVDLNAECDVEKNAALECEREIEHVRDEQKACVEGTCRLEQEEAELLKQLESARFENKAHEVENGSRRRQLEAIVKERQSIEKDRAKANKMRELIEARAAAADKERAALQNEADELTIKTTKLEGADNPLAKKETELLKREIRRHEAELDIVQRKIDLATKGHSRVEEMIRSNDNTLRSQQTELNEFKRACDGLQKARSKLVLEEARDVERLKRIVAVIQVRSCSCVPDDWSFAATSHFHCTDPVVQGEAIVPSCTGRLQPCPQDGCQ